MKSERFWVVADKFSVAKWGKFTNRVEAEAKARETGRKYVASCGVEDWQGSRTYRVRPLPVKA